MRIIGMQRGTIAIVVAVVLLLVSLTVSSQYDWTTSNLQGPITYVVRGEGLPLQFVLVQVSSPTWPKSSSVWPNSFFKVDPLSMVVDLFVWAFVAYGALYLLKLPRQDAAKPPSP
jgi:hypothetical protein